MSQSSDLKLFVERIMNIKVLRSGGASAGVFGYAGVDNEILNKLKSSSIAFATEYRQPNPDQTKLKQFSDDIYGYLQTLQLTSTLSAEEANKLIDCLTKLNDAA